MTATRVLFGQRRHPLINLNSATAAANPFNMQAGPARSGSTEAAADFDRQLSDALTESLRRLGMNPGKMNIRIESGGSSPSARQIVLSWSADEDAPAAAKTASPSVTVTPDAEAGTTAGSVKTTPSGAPEIRLASQAAANPYGYTGAAALNPYFTTPANPLREGYVAGFRNWYRDASIQGGPAGPVPANRLYFATEEGANEALRLVQQHEPAAELVESSWGGGPYSASSSMYNIRLPGDKLLNAGLLLNSYYNGGCGVSVSSDQYLVRDLETA